MKKREETHQPPCCKIEKRQRMSDNEWLRDDEGEDDKGEDDKDDKGGGGSEIWKDFLESKRAFDDQKQREKREQAERQMRKRKQQQQKRAHPKKQKQDKREDGGGGAHETDEYELLFRELNEA